MGTTGERPIEVVFESLESFREVMGRNFNVSESTVDGYVDADVLVAVLRQVADEVSICYQLMSTFLTSSELRVYVYERDETNWSVQFGGLGAVNPLMLPKYLKDYHVAIDDLGLIWGNSGEQICSRFRFSLSWDNQESRRYQRVSVDKLETVMAERRAHLGLA